ncbi:MAG: CsgE family curli-type amyloid fiber assembly protein [Cyclobacteriaceae bacterium]
MTVTACQKYAGKNLPKRAEKDLLIYLLLILFSCSLALGQQDTTRIDSTNIQKRQTETYLRNLLEESIAKVHNTQEDFTDIEISELIISSMISKSGSDFFDYFTTGFSWPSVEGSYIILVSEKPFRTSTTQIQIKVNDLEVFQNVLQPRASYLEELASYARTITVKYILNYQQIMRDLDGYDRSGSGIY